MVDLSMNVPERDLIEFRRIMGYLQTKLGNTPDKAVAIGATFVAKALRSSTVVVGKQKRRVIQNPAISLRTGKPNPRRWLAVNDRVPGALKAISIKGFWATKEEAESRPEVKIGRKGLAQMMWWKAAQRIAADAAGSAPRADSTTEKIASTNMEVTIVKGEDASTAMSNQLNYALLAFKTSGRATVDDAMRRAANSMRKYIERKTGDAIAQRNMA